MELIVENDKVEQSQEERDFNVKTNFDMMQKKFEGMNRAERRKLVKPKHYSIYTKKFVNNKSKGVAQEIMELREMQAVNKFFGTH